ncbi:MAG: hypothetical protein ACREN8_04005 [Candidatus Dormibacteraceae bacterium]
MRIVVSKVREISPSTAAVARMFRLNLRSWSDHPTAHQRTDEVTVIRQALNRLSESSAQGQITWGQRQLAVERIDLDSSNRDE